MRVTNIQEAIELITEFTRLCARDLLMYGDYPWQYAMELEMNMKLQGFEAAY